MPNDLENKEKNAVEWSEKTVKLSALKPYERNPRRITKDAFDRLKNRIARLGYHQRIICQPDGGVIGGHARLRALKELGYKEVKVLIPNRELTNEEFREAIISDNGQFGEWDMDILSADFDMEELIEWGVPEALVLGGSDDEGVNESEPAKGNLAEKFLIAPFSVFNARDDLFPGGTKARFLPMMFEGNNEVVYASPCEGGAQTALAQVAFNLGKQATIFIAKRAKPHPRALHAKRLGAKILQVDPGYLAVVRSRAKAYCARTGAYMAPFGMDSKKFIDAIAAAARQIDFTPDEVWSAAGSGVLARGLAAAFPNARRFAVQIGRKISESEVGGARILKHPLEFGEKCKIKVPFPSDPHYDAKAWEICRTHHGPGKVLFWNVTGPAIP